MAMTMAQAVAQLQQEVFTLRAQVAAECGHPNAVRAIHNLANAQAQKDTPNLIDVKGLGRPEEFSGKEGHFQQWSKKTQAFFAGMIKESEMMLGWAAEQGTEITHESVDLEFLPTGTNVERGVQNLSLCCSRCTQHGWHSRVTKPATLSPTRGRMRWKPGDDYRSDTIQRQEAENVTSCLRSFLVEGALSWNSKLASSHGSPVCRATRRS